MPAGSRAGRSDAIQHFVRDSHVASGTIGSIPKFVNIRGAFRYETSESKDREQLYSGGGQ